MTRPRSDLIDELTGDLQHVRPALKPWTLAGLWLVGSWLFVVGLTLAMGPLRPGVADQLTAEPRFLLEVLLGLAAGALAIHAAGRLGIPGPTAAARRGAPALTLLLLWLAAYLYGITDPALEPSMLGKRAFCYLQTLVYSAPPLAAGLWLLRRAAPLERGWTGALLGAAAAALPALMMQLACMYDPTHILTHHLAPVLAVAAFGALIGRLALKKI